MILSTEIMNAISRFYNVPQNLIKPLNAYYSEVFEFVCDKRSYILKVIKSDRTDQDRLESEVIWLNYLKENGISVAYPVKSAQGNYIERFQISEVESYYFISYIKAEGITPRAHFSDLKRYPEAFLVDWGSYVGKMHKLSSSFHPPKSSFSRPHWKEAIDFFDLSDCPQSQIKIVDRFKETIERIESLPRSMSNFGLIHNDLLEDNMHINKSEIMAFDFEDSSFNWFVNDIAIAFFYPVCYGLSNRKEQLEYGDYFLTSFLRGYRKEKEIGPEDLGSIPLFLKIRELDNYSMFFGDSSAMNQVVVADFMNNRQKRIEDGEPLIHMDFAGY